MARFDDVGKSRDVFAVDLFQKGKTNSCGGAGQATFRKISGWEKPLHWTIFQPGFARDHRQNENLLLDDA
jgi:hypothetical protein